MDKNQAKEFYPILQAYAEGKVIECRTKPSALEDGKVPNEWAEIKVIEFNGNKEYRIKPNLEPESEYRPFKDAEECWAEMKKHEPFGWVIKHNEDKMLIGEVDSFGGVILYNQRGSKFDFDEANRIFTFADGTPFGVKNSL